VKAWTTLPYQPIRCARAAVGGAIILPRGAALPISPYVRKHRLLTTQRSIVRAEQLARRYANVPNASRPFGLPDFKHPPIDEVVLSVQFASLENFRSAHAGLFWRSIRAKYPSVTEQPALPPAFETFGTPPVSNVPLVQFHPAPVVPRFWFEKPGDPSLLQVQQDRIIHNWRKREGQPIYPRYEAIRRAFESEIGAFSKFLKSEQLGELRPNQCEVTYINIIEMPDRSNPHLRLGDVTPLWSSRTSEPISGEFEVAGLQARFTLADEGKHWGRLYLNFQPAMRQTDFAPVIRLEITARGKPKEETISEALLLLDQERLAVVRTFAAVTTSEMHKVWGRKDAG
jgi:uncharacterized protein (TIGR04255 family)